jgi:hypothetical protein
MEDDVTKVVYNACYGGFSLSEAGMRRYAELKGMAIYPEHDTKFASLGMITYWTVPPEKRVDPLEGEAWHAATMEERQAHNAAYIAQTIGCRDFDRDDPILVQVVEELGDAANGRAAKLKIEDVPAGMLYRIDEYDGAESVMTQGDYEWKLA